MGELIEAVKGYYNNLALRPAQESLYGYYEKFGFKTAFYNQKINKINIAKPIEIKKVTDINEFIETRNSLLPTNSLNLSFEALEFVLEQYEVFTDLSETKQNLAIFYVDNDVANIRELLSNKDTDGFIAAILKETNCNKFTALMPSVYEQEKSGMIYPPNLEVNYLGLALD